MKKLRYYTFAIIFILCATALAQNNLTEKEKDEIELQCIQSVKEFEAYIKAISDENLPNTSRQKFLDSALNLFIGNGKGYSIQNAFGETEIRKPVQMQISSYNSRAVRSVNISTFLNNLYKNIYKYDNLAIVSVDLVRIGNYTQIGEGKYEAIAYYTPKYKTFKNEAIAHSVSTEKTIKVYLDSLPTSEGKTWGIKLGDIYVLSTK